MKPTSAQLAQAIRDITSEWISDGRVANIREIGDGHCYDFARSVMDRLQVAKYGAGYSVEDSHNRLIDVQTEDWWMRILNQDGSDSGEAECFTIDIARLRRENAPIPAWLRDDDLEMAGIIGSMTHNWLVLDGLHYDATCPEGAEHFLLMPFFADQISHLRPGQDPTD